MELVKELPEIFEEFAEQRQRSFLVMKEVKDKGIPVVGAYCTYFPQEIAMAMGAVTVGLCSTSDETIPIAEKDLPKNLCPLFKYVLCRVCQTSVNVTCICKSESCCCMCRVLKYIRCCLVNRYCSGIRCRIWFFLSYVKLKCFKFIIAHIFLPLFSTV